MTSGGDPGADVGTTHADGYAGPRFRAAQEGIWAWRVVVGCLALAAVCFRQSPGLVVPDTKLDLTANPGGLVARAFSFWSANSFGELQNQGYGYLFPMGPFHRVLHELGVPAWAVQRLWWSLVLGVAFVGFWRLSGALRLGTPGVRYAGAFLFALSPRFVAEVAITSIEVWPMAMAPWVLLPLVDPRRRTRSQRVLGSAVAFGCVGGVNAVASGAVLVLPTLWFLTRGGGWRVVGRWVGWLGACLAAAAWWIGPLLLLGRFSPPFLDWIESAQVTTGMSSTFNAVQGTSAWLTFLSGPTGPSWPAGWLYVTRPVLVVGTGLVAALGLGGLCVRGMPERRWLVLSAATGLLLLSVGFSGALASPLAPVMRELLDGPLVALRNIHKFEMVLRVPLVLGFVHALGAVQSRWVAASMTRGLPRWLPVGVVALLVVSVAAPALASRLPRDEGYTAIPDHWRQAAAWLDASPEPGSVLVVPAASFADFTWGSTKDEPFQALLRRPFAVRDAVPLGTAGTTRLLDEIMNRLGEGRGGPDLRETLTGMGVRYVVVRGDLRLDVQGSEPLAVHQALDESEIERVAYFGLTSHSTVETATATVNERTVLPYPSVEIFDVVGGGVPGGVVTGPRLVPQSSLVRAAAGPEDVPSLQAQLGGSTAAILGNDGQGVTGLSSRLPVVLTDGQRRQEVFFGRSSENRSPTLSATDPGRQSRKVIDYVSDPGVGQTVLAWDGLTSVSASSSAADPGATLRLGPGFGPAQAFDGDPATRWVSGTFQGAVGEWLEVTFPRPVSLEGSLITVSRSAPISAAPGLVRVETDSGATTVLLADTDLAQPLLTPKGATQRLRVRLETTRGPNAGNGFSIAELSIPSVTPGARLDLPAAPAGPIGSILLRSEDPGLSGCLFVGERPLCASRFVKAPVEPEGLHRTFALGAANLSPGGLAQLHFSGTVLPRPGAALNALLERRRAVTATASSVAVPGPAGGPGSAVDADLGTGWVASPDDASPSLNVRLPQPRRLDRIQLLADRALAASPPDAIRVTFSDGSVASGSLDDQGRFRFPARVTRALDIAIVGVHPVRSVEASSGFTTQLPAGVSEVLIPGAAALVRPTLPDRSVSVPCGQGPDVTVAGQSLRTEVVGTVRQVLRGEPMQWRACGGTESVVLGAGPTRVDARSSPAFVPASMSLTTLASRNSQGGSGPSHDGDGWRLPVRNEASVLVMSHNYNMAWSASTDTGHTLSAVRINGWQQGYVVPAGAVAVVTEHFGPARSYQLALLGGLTVLVLLAGLWFGLRRCEGRAQQHVGVGEAVIPPARWPVGLVTLVVLAAHGGPPVIALAGGAAIMRTMAPPRWRGDLLAAAVAAVGVSLAALIVALNPWTRGAAAVDSTAVQLLVVAGFVAAAETTWRSERRARRRMGRSTA